MPTDAEPETTAETPRAAGPDSRGAEKASRDQARPKHRPESGWPFWWRWVVATNLGWFPGIFLGLCVANLPVDPSAATKACLAALVASSFFGATQAFSLRHTLARPSPLVRDNRCRLDHRHRDRPPLARRHLGRPRSDSGRRSRRVHRWLRRGHDSGSTAFELYAPLAIVATDIGRRLGSPVSRCVGGHRPGLAHAIGICVPNRVTRFRTVH